MSLRTLCIAGAVVVVLAISVFLLKREAAPVEEEGAMTSSALDGVADVTSFRATVDLHRVAARGGQGVLTLGFDGVDRLTLQANARGFPPGQYRLLFVRQGECPQPSPRRIAPPPSDSVVLVLGPVKANGPGWIRMSLEDGGIAPDLAQALVGRAVLVTTTGSDPDEHAVLACGVVRQRD